MAKINSKYWADRQLEDFLEGEKSALELSKELQANYEKAISDIEKESLQKSRV